MSSPAVLGGSPVFLQKVPIVRPALPPLEPLLRDARDLLESGQLTNGRYVRELERKLAERLGVPECVALSSCTSGLTLVLRALELEGEVILPSFTFFAAGHALLWNGLTPVFADCEPHTFNIDPGRVEALIGPATSAIVATHVYGNPASTEALESLSRRRGLKLIFDAAHALGSRCEGRAVGSFGDAEVFSLSPTKPLVGGEGGVVATRHQKLADRLRAARNYGDHGTYDPILLGLSARLPEFNALLALHGLAYLDEGTARHNSIAARYMQGFKQLPGISFQKVRPQDKSAYKDFSIVINPATFGLSRDALFAALTAENLEVKKYFCPPLHRQALYRRFRSRRKGTLAVTETISYNVLCLPMFTQIRDEVVDRIVEAVNRIYTHRARVAAALRQPPVVYSATSA